MAKDQALDAPEQADAALGDTARPPAPSQSWIGRVIDGRYQIEAKLGEGGMGAVYVARHLKLQKAVALKVVRAELAGNGEVAIRFAREAMTTAQFEHPHVAGATDYGSLPEGGAYLVMQLVQGHSLRAKLAEGPLPWRRACRLLAQVADALSAARANGIVHRDLKPENILVETREDGSDLATVLDFGIAHIAPAQAAVPEGAAPQRALTRVGAIIGTPGYMAPEQAVGDRVDHRTDLYALGVVLWESIAGRELWDGPDIATIIMRQVSEEPPALTQIVGQTAVPRELDAHIRQLLARRPEDRPEHAGEVRDLLRRLAESSDGSEHSDRSQGSSARISPDIRWHARRLADRVRVRAAPLRVRTDRVMAAWKAQPLPRRRTQAGAGALLLLLAVVVPSLLAGDKPQPNQPQQAPTTTMVGRIVTKVGAALTPGIPVEIANEIDTLLNGERRRERRDAAVLVLAFKPRETVAPHIIALAELETARGCPARRKAINAIADLADDRALPALERWQRTPKRGCGFLDLQDCHGCIRQPLRNAVSALKSAN